MESVTAFLLTSPVALFLVPVILILVVALITLTVKSHKGEASVQQKENVLSANIPQQITPQPMPTAQTAPVSEAVQMAPQVSEPPKEPVIPSWRPSVTPVMEQVLEEAKTQEPAVDVAQSLPSISQAAGVGTVSKDIANSSPAINQANHPQA